MKTLINKANPQIRITAPEIEENEYQYTVNVGKLQPLIFLLPEWTLVEEENISFADRLKERLENMTQEEFEKAMNEMYVDGDESPTLEEYLKAAYHSPIETEPVDLEKFIEKAQRVLYSSNPDDYIKLVKELAELGQKRR